jgi:hypothetical protein
MTFCSKDMHSEMLNRNDEISICVLHEKIAVFSNSRDHCNKYQGRAFEVDARKSSLHRDDSADYHYSPLFIRTHELCKSARMLHRIFACRRQVYMK